MNNLKKIKYFVTNVETGVVHSNIIEIPDPAKFFNQKALNSVTADSIIKDAIVDWAIVDDLASTHNIKYSPDKYDISWEYVNDPILNSIDTTTLESEAEVSHILDSGDRTEYKTGAVRDNREGKGRCDLIPLKYMADIIGYDDDPYVGKIIRHIYDFQQTRDVRFLKHAIDLFIDLGMYDDIFTAFLELSKHYEEGAKKYGEYNWQKGIPLHCYIDSGIRHLLKFARGDKDEPHDRAFIWNMIGAMWTYDNKPELDDYTGDHRPVT